MHQPCKYKQHLQFLNLYFIATVPFFFCSWTHKTTSYIGVASEQRKKSTLDWKECKVVLLQEGFGLMTNQYQRIQTDQTCP